MPFKHKRSTYYQLRRRTLPGYGKIGRISTRVRSKALAVRMKDLLTRIAERGLEDPSWYALIDALVRKEITLPELYRAHTEHRLAQLKRMLEDPLLSAAIESYVEATSPGYATRNGLRVLEDMAVREFGKKARLGTIRSGKNITVLCHRAKREGGRPSEEHPRGRPMAHNSAHRTILLSTSKLLRFHLGAAERDRIFADVAFARERDTRDVWLCAEELDRLLAAAEPFFRPVILTAVLSGADRSPLLRLRVRDVTIRRGPDGRLSGQIYLRDSKTDARPRSVAIVEAVSCALRPLLYDERGEPKQPDDAVFYGPPFDRYGRPARPEPLNAHQVRYWFDKARQAAGLGHVRFKDLRRTWAVNADQAGLNLGQMKSGMGHARSETTVGYTNRQLMLDLEAARRVARQLGMEPPGGKEPESGKAAG